MYVNRVLFVLYIAGRDIIRIKITLLAKSEMLGLSCEQCTDEKLFMLKQNANKSK